MTTAATSLLCDELSCHKTSHFFQHGTYNSAQKASPDFHPKLSESDSENGIGGHERGAGTSEDAPVNKHQEVRHC